MLHRLRRPSIGRIVREQARDGQPPEVRAAYERLRGLGWPERRVWAVLASCLRVGIAVMMRDCQLFDDELYARLLAAAERYPKGVTIKDLDAVYPGYGAGGGR
jgi:hypothetical protein